MNKNIKNIVFDVGMVLVDFCWAQHCRNLEFNETIIESFDQNMISSGVWDQLDEGTITQEDAIREFIRKMPQYEQQVITFWQSPEEFVKEYAYATPLIQTLKKQGYNVYLLSNYPIGIYHIHWPAFSFLSHVDGYIVSAIERIKKPDPAIYRLLCDRFQLKPEECLFIDDRQVNVDAAISVGMESVLFENYEQLRDLFIPKV